MNLFKLFIPKENAQYVTELESWTVKWAFKEGWSDRNVIKYKVFVKHNEALEFEKQLNESAKFIGCWISTRTYKN